MIECREMSDGKQSQSYKLSMPMHLFAQEDVWLRLQKNKKKMKTWPEIAFGKLDVKFLPTKCNTTSADTWISLPHQSNQQQE